MKKENKKFWSPNFMAEFKKWMEDTQDSHIQKGNRVNTHLKLKTLVERIDCIETFENPVIEIAKNFIKHGGIVKSIDEDTVKIKTKKGIFNLNREDLIQD